MFSPGRERTGVAKFHLSVLYSDRTGCTMGPLRRGSLISCLIVAAVASAAPDWECIPPESSFGPLPPVLPDSYYMAFEVVDVIGKTKHANEVWYDWQGQRARIRAVDQAGTVRELVSFYSFDTGFRYIESEPGANNGDGDRVFNCDFFDLNVEKNTPFLEKGDQPLRMVDIYQALLFGGKYQYRFVKTDADESSRFINTNRFTTCVTDRISGRRLNVTYHWAVDGSSPVRFDIDGGSLNDQGELELRVHQVASVIRFERDPEMDADMFAVPRTLHCRNDPRTPTMDFPVLSADFSWREEVINYARDDRGLLLRDQSSTKQRELWSSQIFRLARMDWTPSAEDGKTFEPFIGKTISVIADVDYRALFIVQPATGQCRVVPMTKDFALVKGGENGSFDLREPLDLLGMTKEHINKGEHLERGSLVTVFSRFDDTDASDGTMTIHEATFRRDEELAKRSSNYYALVPETQLTRKLLATVDEKTMAYERAEQVSYFKVQADFAHLEKFEAEACVAHHQKRLFQISFATDFKEVIYGNGYEFLNRLRFLLVRAGNLGSPLQVQQLKMFEDHENNKVVVRMTLLEPLPEIASSRNTSVDQARDAIVDALDRHQLAVPIEWQGESNTIVPEAGSFVEYTRAEKKVFAHPRMVRAATFSGNVPVTNGVFSSVDLAVICVCVFVVGAVVGFSSVALHRELQMTR